MWSAIGCSSPTSADQVTPLGSMDRKCTPAFSRRALGAASLTSQLRKETDMSNNKSIQRIAIIGTGVIGASWAALFLAKGLEVVATDVAPGAEAALRRFVDQAWPALKRLGLEPGASRSKLTFVSDLPTAVKGVDLVQEN